jgi:hypothetical protein
MSHFGRAPEVPVFHPTDRDMLRPFEEYVASIEKRFAHVGLAKVVPPKSWRARASGYGRGWDVVIPKPIKCVFLSFFF